MANFNRMLQSKERGGLLEVPHIKNGKRWRFMPFLFNPQPFKIDDSQRYEITPIPLWPEPVLNYVAGEGASAKFDIYLEQDRINEFLENANGLNNFNTIRAIGNENSGVEIATPVTVDDYIAYIESLKLPKQDLGAGNFFEASPSRVMFIFGKFFRIGYIAKTSISYDEYFNNGGTRSAVINVTFLLSYGYANQIRQQANTYITKTGG